jgi:hypothetical protein
VQAHCTECGAPIRIGNEGQPLRGPANQIRTAAYTRRILGLAVSVGAVLMAVYYMGWGGLLKYLEHPGRVLPWLR